MTKMESSTSRRQKIFALGACIFNVILYSVYIKVIIPAPLTLTMWIYIFLREEVYKYIINLVDIDI